MSDSQTVLATSPVNGDEPCSNRSSRQSSESGSSATSSRSSDYSIDSSTESSSISSGCEHESQGLVEAGNQDKIRKFWSRLILRRPLILSKARQALQLFKRGKNGAVNIKSTESSMSTSAVSPRTAAIAALCKEDTGPIDLTGLPPDAIPIISGRLFFLMLQDATRPRNTTHIHYFCTDFIFIYEPFFSDFGPLSISCVYKYACMLESKLADTGRAKKALVHYVSAHPEMRANAVMLMGAAQLLLMQRSAEESYRPFLNFASRIPAFRDASCGPSHFHITVMDCLKGLERAIQLGWFDTNNFDVEAYDFYERMENGDLNWIIPGKFLAFSCPSTSPLVLAATAPENPRVVLTCCTPDYYAELFCRLGVKLVIRLNKKLYEERKFTSRNIQHEDLFFMDGTCPSRDIIGKFLSLTEWRNHPIAVHCKAGLGRTGTLIGCFAIKNYRFPAASWIAWNRLCRPGSVLGPQQQFLADIQCELMQMGVAESVLRTRPVAPPSAASLLPTQHTDEGVSDSFAELSIDAKQAEEHGEAGQGDRLLQAKRIQQQASRYILRTSATAAIASSSTSVGSSVKETVLSTMRV